MSQLETRKTWSTGELKNISMYYIFPVLNPSRYCFSSPIFVLWLLKEDLQIWALNLPSIFRYLFPRAANLGGFVKSDFQPTWLRVGKHNKRLSSGWWWKWNRAQKIVIPVALCQPCHMKLFFFVFLPRLSLNSWSQVHFKTSFFFQFQLPFRSKTISNILRILTN